MVAKDSTLHFLVKLISADLKDVTSMREGYVDVSIAGQHAAGRVAHVEKDAGKSLKWNDEVNLFVGADMLTQNPNLPLVFRIRSQDPSGDTDIGATSVLVREVVFRITLAAYRRVEGIVTYPVVSPSGKPIGTLKVSFKVDDLVGTLAVAQAAAREVKQIMARDAARDPSDLDNEYLVQAGYLLADMVAGLPVEAAREPHPDLSDPYPKYSAARGAGDSFTKNNVPDAVNEILDKLYARVAPKIFKYKEPVNAGPAYAEYASPQHHYSGHTQAACAYAPPQQQQQHSWYAPPQMPAASAHAPPQQQQQHSWYAPPQMPAASAHAPPQQQHGWYTPPASAYAPPQQQQGWYTPPASAYAPPQQQHGWYAPPASAYAPPQQQHGWYAPPASAYPRPPAVVAGYATHPAAYAVCAPPQKNNNFEGMLGKIVQFLTIAKLSGDVTGMSADFDGMGADDASSGFENGGSF